MAYTFTNVTQSVMGNQRVQMGLLTTDAASGVVSFGLGVLTGYSVSNQSATTGGVRFRMNAVAGGTASLGDLGVSGATSGDTFIVIVYGR